MTAGGLDSRKSQGKFNSIAILEENYYRGRLTYRDSRGMGNLLPRGYGLDAAFGSADNCIISAVSFTCNSVGSLEAGYGVLKENLG